jgi:4-hydroxy-tetrahydrodipicolinate reductase
MKIALLGTGKMGQAVEAKAIAAGHEIVLRINASNLQELTEEHLKKADVVIEFSRPDAVVENLMKCLDAGIPVVCGTTGWHEDYKKVSLLFLEKGGALLSATNFSVGVNLLFQLNIELTKWMNRFPEYTPAIEEIHHTRKLDKPSGTAVTLAMGIIEQSQKINSWKLREDETRVAENDLPIDARRESNVIGIHEVTWTSPIDNISIRHEAFNRDGFATGALIAAEWIIGKKGVFGMNDLLFSKQNL